MKKIALIGAGKWGQNFIKTANQLNHLELSHIVSRNPKTRDLSPRSTIIDTFEILLKVSDQLDGVIVATPPQIRSEIILPLLERNIDILSEKPLCMDLKTLKEIEAAYEVSDAEILIDYTHLHNSALKEFFSLLKSNPPKKVISFNSNHGPFRDFSGYWDYGPHEFALMTRLNGETKPQAKLEKLDPMKDNLGEFYRLSANLENNVEFVSYFGNGDQSKQRSITAFYDDHALCFNDLSQEKLVKYEVDLKVSNFDWEQKKKDLSYTKIPFPNCDQSPLANLLVEFCDVIDKKMKPSTNIALGDQVVTSMVSMGF